MAPRRHEPSRGRRPNTPARNAWSESDHANARNQPTLKPASAAAVAVAVGLVAVAVRGIAAVGRVAVVAVRGLAVAIPATISTISVAVVISGGSLGGGDAAERGDGGDCDEGFLEGVHVHVLRVRCRTVRRDQRGEHHTG